MIKLRLPKWSSHLRVNVNSWGYFREIFRWSNLTRPWPEYFKCIRSYIGFKWLSIILRIERTRVSIAFWGRLFLVHMKWHVNGPQRLSDAGLFHCKRMFCLGMRIWTKYDRIPEILESNQSSIKIFYCIVFDRLLRSYHLKTKITAHVEFEFCWKMRIAKVFFSLPCYLKSSEREK